MERMKLTKEKRGEAGRKRAETGAERNDQREQRPRRAFCGVGWLRTFATSPVRSVTKEKRGEAGCEGAWTEARASAGPRSGRSASPRGWESDRATSPVRSVTKADGRVLAVCMAAGAVMLLYFVWQSAAMTVLYRLPWEPPSPQLPAEGSVNINTAGLEELMTLPGIGEARARAILDDRELNGPFRYPEDLTRVKGIGEGILAGLLDQITTGGQEYAEDFSG